MPDIDTIAQLPDSMLPFYMWQDAYPLPTIDTCTGIPLDSIFRPCGPDNVVVRPSLFTGHPTVQEDAQLTARNDNVAPAWVFCAIVLLCAMLCTYYRSHKVKIIDLIKSTVDMRGAERLVRSMSPRRSMPLVPIALMLTAALALPVWSMAMSHTGFVGYLLLFLALAAGYLLRNGLLNLFATVFDRQQAMRAYIDSNYLFHLLLATIVTPLLFVVAYVPSASTATLWVIAFVVAVSFLMRFFRGIQLFLTKSKSFSLLLFYYLCIVEIIPPVVLLWWFISQ